MTLKLGGSQTTNLTAEVVVVIVVKNDIPNSSIEIL